MTNSVKTLSSSLCVRASQRERESSSLPKKVRDSFSSVVVCALRNYNRKATRKDKKSVTRKSLSLHKVSNQNLSLIIIIIISLSFKFRAREDKEEHFCDVVVFAY